MSNMNGLIVRPYVDNDFSAVVNYQLPEEQAIYTSLPIHVIQAHQKNPDYQPYVVYMDDELIGCFALHTGSTSNFYTANEDAVVFKSFSIDSRYQNKGHALETIRLLPEIATDHYPDKDEIVLTVHHTNTPAKNLYIKAGFLDHGLRYEGEHGEEFIFHLRLDREKSILSSSDRRAEF